MVFNWFNNVTIEKKRKKNEEDKRFANMNTPKHNIWLIYTLDSKVDVGLGNWVEYTIGLEARQFTRQFITTMVPHSTILLSNTHSNSYNKTLDSIIQFSSLHQQD